MKKLYIIPALVALLAVGCNSASSEGGSSSGNSWSKDVQSEMKTYIGEVLPYATFESSSFTHGWDKDYEAYYLNDESEKSLLGDYDAKLKKAGWTLDSDEIVGDSYYKSNSVGDLTLIFGWDEATEEFTAGNYIIVFVDETGGGGGDPSGEWSDEIKSLMREHVGEVLPYAPFDEETLEYGWDSEDGCFWMEDINSQDIFTGYSAKLQAAGWEEFLEGMYAKGETLFLMCGWEEATEGLDAGNFLYVYVDEESGGGSGGGDPGDGTNWSEAMITEMKTYIGEILPYVQFHDTNFVHGWDDYEYCYYIDDDSSESIFTGVDYSAKLKNAGWVEDEDIYGDTYYYKENEIGELYLYFGYYEASSTAAAGNEIAVYVEEAGGGSGEIEGDTIVFGELNLEDGVSYAEGFEAESFYIYFEGGENDGKYYDSGEAIRIYGGGSVVIEANEGLKITEVQFDWVQATSKTDFPSASAFKTGSYNAQTYVWTGNTDVLVATRPSGKGHWALAGISVVVE